jgi:hypothetical protein
VTDNWLDESGEWADEPDDQGPSDTTIESDVESKISDGAVGERLIAALPDGRYLVLSGAGAGSAVLDGAETTAVGPTIPSRDNALAPGAPSIMLVHRPHQAAGVIPRLLASIVAATQGGVSLGVSAMLPSSTEATAAQWLSAHPAAALRLADPGCFLMDPTLVRIPAVSERALRWAPYLGQNEIDVSELLDIQRRVGANILLSPGRALDSTNPQRSLDAAFANADEALSQLQAGERMALNLTMSAQWLASTTLRELLFAQLVDQEQFDLWHVRVQWPASLRAFQQPTDASLLTGYKRLAQLASDEGHRLILPQTGSTGWLQLGFGAAGFGAGPFGSGQAFKEHSQGGGGGITPVPRYFEPTLLHYVERSVHEALASQSGYETCDCPYCPALLGAADWDHELARLHGLHWLGRLAASPTTSGRPTEAAVRRTVRTAILAAESQPLAGISSPQHLRAWDQLL